LVNRKTILPTSNPDLFQDVWNQRNHLAKYSGARAEWMEQTQDEARRHDARASAPFPQRKGTTSAFFDQATLMESWKNLDRRNRYSHGRRRFFFCLFCVCLRLGRGLWSFGV